MFYPLFSHLLPVWVCFFPFLHWWSPQRWEFEGEILIGAAQRSSFLTRERWGKEGRLQEGVKLSGSRDAPANLVKFCPLCAVLLQIRGHFFCFETVLPQIWGFFTFYVQWCPTSGNVLPFMWFFPKSGDALFRVSFASNLTMFFILYGHFWISYEDTLPSIATFAEIWGCFMVQGHDFPTSGLDFALYCQF